MCVCVCFFPSAVCCIFCLVCKIYNDALLLPLPLLFCNGYYIMHFVQTKLTSCWAAHPPQNVCWHILFSANGWLARTHASMHPTHWPANSKREMREFIGWGWSCAWTLSDADTVAKHSSSLCCTTRRLDHNNNNMLSILVNTHPPHHSTSFEFAAVVVAQFCWHWM